MGETKYNFAKIEKKWQKKWEQEGIFEAEPDSKKEKFFFTSFVFYRDPSFFDIDIWCPIFTHSTKFNYMGLGRQIAYSKHQVVSYLQVIGESKICCLIIH